jgi:putative acetyltransferase
MGTQFVNATRMPISAPIEYSPLALLCYPVALIMPPKDKATTIKRTNSDDADFQRLVVELDKELAVRDGAEHSFYAQFNNIDAIRHSVVAYLDGEAVGCGAIKEYSDGVMEVKRMFVPEESRGQGIASVVLMELEKWAKELNAERCILETGVKQPEAIRLYEKNGYLPTTNYGQYAGIENSVCFEKDLAR